MVGNVYRQRKTVGGFRSQVSRVKVPEQIGTTESVRQDPWYIGDQGQKTWDLLNKEVGSMFQKAMSEEGRKQAIESANKQQVEEQMAAKNQGRDPEMVKANPFMKFFVPDQARAFEATTRHLYEENIGLSIQKKMAQLQTDIQNNPDIPVEQKAAVFEQKFEDILDKETSNADFTTLNKVASKYYGVRNDVMNKFLANAVDVKRSEQYRDKEKNIDEAIYTANQAARNGEDINLHVAQLLDLSNTLKAMNPTNEKEAIWLENIAKKVESGITQATALKEAAGMTVEEKGKFIDDIKNGRIPKDELNIKTEEQLDDLISALEDQESEAKDARTRGEKEATDAADKSIFDALNNGAEVSAATLEDFRQRAEEKPAKFAKKYEELREAATLAPRVKDWLKWSPKELKDGLLVQQQILNKLGENTPAIEQKAYKVMSSIYAERESMRVAGRHFESTLKRKGIEVDDADEVGTLTDVNEQHSVASLADEDAKETVNLYKEDDMVRMAASYNDPTKKQAILDNIDKIPEERQQVFLSQMTEKNPDLAVAATLNLTNEPRARRVVSNSIAGSEMDNTEDATNVKAAMREVISAYIPLDKNGALIEAYVRTAYDAYKAQTNGNGGRDDVAGNAVMDVLGLSDINTVLNNSAVVPFEYGMKPADMKYIMDSLKPGHFMAMNNRASPIMEGKPVSIDQLKQAQLYYIGNGKYVMGIDGKGIQNSLTGNPYIFDYNLLR